MQLRNREADDFVSSESSLALLDFPTEEELLAALDASFVVVSPPVADTEPELSVEPDFLLDFASFLLARLQKRAREMRQAQGQLTNELARLQLSR